MGDAPKPDMTKEESGLQQYDRVGPTREPSIGYDENGNRLKANDLPFRSEEEENAMTDAMIAARDNRRDKPSEVLPKDSIDPAFTGPNARQRKH